MKARGQIPEDKFQKPSTTLAREHPDLTIVNQGIQGTRSYQDEGSYLLDKFYSLLVHENAVTPCWTPVG